MSFWQNWIRYHNTALQQDRALAIRGHGQGGKTDNISLRVAAAYYAEDTRGPQLSCYLRSLVSCYWSGTKHTVNRSVGNSTHLEGSQAGKKHVACKKPHVTAPWSEELAGLYRQPFCAITPPSRQPGVLLSVLDLTHVHGHHCTSMPWSPSCRWQAVIPPGKSEGQPSWEVTG